MAKRKLEEINAGSMADIAFLLLIFFLVTTTMEVDAGISRQLPIKRDPPPGYVPPDIRDRDIMIIMANSQDMLFVEGEFMELEDLEAKVIDFFTANAEGALNADGKIDNNPKMPEYKPVTRAFCMQKVTEFKTALEAAPANQKEFFTGELNKWEKKIATMDLMGVDQFNEISSQAVIQLKNQSGTTYGLYIEIQNILKKVINDLRDEKSRELGWGPYKKLDAELEADIEKIEALTVLVPERIIEAKIEQ